VNTTAQFEPGVSAGRYELQTVVPANALVTLRRGHGFCFGGYLGAGCWGGGGVLICCSCLALVSLFKALFQLLYPRFQGINAIKEHFFVA
jgi:hypothetical protein